MVFALELNILDMDNSPNNYEIAVDSAFVA